MSLFGTHFPLLAMIERVDICYLHIIYTRLVANLSLLGRCNLMWRYGVCLFGLFFGDKILEVNLCFSSYIQRSTSFEVGVDALIEAVLPPGSLT